MRISILGCGWVGLPLGAALAVKGHEVRGSRTSPERFGDLIDAGIEPHRIHLEPEFVGEKGFLETDTLVLTLPPERRDDIETYYPAQLRHALENAKAEHVVFTSSTSVYPNLNRTVTEEDAQNPDKRSGRAVLAAEEVLRDHPNATILRLAGLYGYDRQPGRRLAGKEVTGGDAPVNLVHRDDVVSVLVKVIEENIQGVFNVCADKHPSRQEVYTAQAERLGFEPPHFVEPSHADYKEVSSEKLKGLGYEFQHGNPLEEAP